MNAILIILTILAPGRKDLELAQGEPVCPPLPQVYMYTEAECYYSPVCEHDGYRPDSVVRWWCEEIGGTLYVCNVPHPYQAFTSIEAYWEFAERRRLYLESQGVELCNGSQWECRRVKAFISEVQFR